MTDAEIVNEIIHILNSPESPTESDADRGNLLDLIEDVLKSYWELDERLNGAAKYVIGR